MDAILLYVYQKQDNFEIPPVLAAGREGREQLL